MEGISDKVYNGVDYTRQHDFMNPQKYGAVPIIVVGAGAVGSFAVLGLTKMGFHNITVFDFDNVSQENIPNQLYPLNKNGSSKVGALDELTRMFSGLPITAVMEPWSKEVMEKLYIDYRDMILISCVDNMQTRKEMYELYMQYPEEFEMFLDARMGGLVYKIHSITTPKDNFEWHPDSEAVADPCTAKAIIFNVMSIGGMIANMVFQYVVKDVELPKLIVGDLNNFKIADINAWG